MNRFINLKKKPESIYDSEKRGDGKMPAAMDDLLQEYVEQVSKVYGEYLKSVILYGSYARGDFGPDSDIDLMILLDMTDREIKDFRHQLSGITYDFNEKYDLDIRPIAKSEAHFKKWLGAYPFYTNVQKEGVELYGTAG